MNKFLRNTILTFGTITLGIGVLCFTGESAIENIKSKVELMKQKIILISDDRDAVLGKLNDTILKYDTDIKLLNDKKANIELEIKELNKQLEDNKTTSDSIIHDAEEIIDQLTTEKENLQAQVDQLTTEKENLQAQLQANANDLSTLQNEILRLNNELGKANNAVANLENYVNLKYDEISNITTETNLDNYNTTVSPDFSDNSSNDSNSNENVGNVWKFNESNFFVVKDILTLRKTNDRDDIIYTRLPDSATDVNIKVTVSYKGIANQVTSITVDQPTYEFFLGYTKQIKQIEITGSCNISGVTHQFDELVNVDYN